MAQPSFLASGTTPLRTDTRLRRWTKILGHYQNQAGAKAKNNPKPNNTRRQIMVKLANAVNGT